MGEIRVAVLDDIKGIGHMLEELLTQEHPIASVGENVDIKEALRVIREMDPDIIIISSSGREKISKEAELESQVTYLLHELGIPANIRGHQYLRDAISIVVKHPEYIRTIMKLLYPQVAKINHSTPSRVERSIRHAIQTACSRGKTEVFNDIFGKAILEDRWKPTNSEFIALVADAIRGDYHNA